MATHGLSEAEFEECEDTFKFLDTNSDERVELRELCSGLSELGLCLTNSEIKAFLDHFGKDSHEYLIFPTAHETCPVLGLVALNKRR